jgi:segregation and condensation protein B
LIAGDQPREQQRLDVASADGTEPSAAIEALLFVSSEGETVARLASALGWTQSEVRAGVDALEQALIHPVRGIALQRSGDYLQLVSSPRFGTAVARLLGLERTLRISGAALETLALVAYRQPITRSEIEAVRGVDSGSVIATLLTRDLIVATGRRSSPGTPTDYATTALFLQSFGLSSLAELRHLGDGATPLSDAEQQS